MALPLCTLLLRREELMIENGVQIYIHTERLRANAKKLLARCATLLPVLKTDAYGHGMETVARVLEEEGIDMIAVGTVGEAIRLRQAGIRTGLVAMLGLLTPDDACQAAEFGVMPLIHSMDNLRQLAEHSGSRLDMDIALKCNTGMNRLGFRPDELPDMLSALARQPLLHPRVAITHLACADEDAKDTVTLAQIRQFAEMMAMLRSRFPHLRSSLLNSSGLLIWPELLRDAKDRVRLAPLGAELARPGLLLYGENPLYGTSRANLYEGFQPVMEARTSVLSVHDLRPGESLSYGHSYTATTLRRIAVVAAGYAEGFPRALSGRGYVNFHGGRAPILGRVCMQMTLVDVTDIEGVRPGDPVWLLGGPADGRDLPITACEQAQWAGTIPYDIACALGRNRRIDVA